ncbi:MAG: DUF1501 domain-containing protein [Bacteroidota bacterium]
MLDDLQRLNRLQFSLQGDPETETRITQYELAFRMQASVPELMKRMPADFSNDRMVELVKAISFFCESQILSRFSESS